MNTHWYAFRVKTIESIRLQNYEALIQELSKERGHELKDPEVAQALGISKVYAWQLRNKKRDSIDSKAARKIEAKAGKPNGWLDTNFSLWPFPGISSERFDQLTPEEKLEIQGSVRQLMIEFEQRRAPSQGEISSPSLAVGGQKK